MQLYPVSWVTTVETTETATSAIKAVTVIVYKLLAYCFSKIKKNVANALNPQMFYCQARSGSEAMRKNSEGFICRKAPISCSRRGRRNLAAIRGHFNCNEAYAKGV